MKITCISLLRKGIWIFYDIRKKMRKPFLVSHELITERPHLFNNKLFLFLRTNHGESINQAPVN